MLLISAGIMAGCSSSQTTNTTQAQTTSANSSNAVASVEDESLDPNAITCKSYTRTGSRIPTKVCKTNASWEQARLAAQEAARDVQTNSLTSAGRAGG